MKSKINQSTLCQFYPINNNVYKYIIHVTFIKNVVYTVYSLNKLYIQLYRLELYYIIFKDLKKWVCNGIYGKIMFSRCCLILHNWILSFYYINSQSEI